MTFGGSSNLKHSRVLMLCTAFALATGVASAAGQTLPDAAEDPPCTIEGTAGDDKLVGTAGNDVMCGYGGNDTLEGRGGDDILIGGPGDDLLAGNGGNDELFGHAGEDWLFGGPGDDLLGGGGGADLLRGGIGNDELHGGGGGDTVIGQDGDDELWGGSGADLIEGRAGNDTLRGGPGKDQLSGNAGNDFLFGQAADDILFGGPGIDVLAGGGGNDVARGGAADDELHGEDGVDRLIGGDGNDLMWGGTGDDTIEGRLGNDTLRGGPDDDVLAGNEGFDDLYGGTGDDRLYGGPDTDTCDGGPGTNTLVGCAVNPPSIEEPFTFGTTLVGTPTVLAGRAFDHFSGGVVAVRLAIEHRASGEWLQTDGSFTGTPVFFSANLAPGTSGAFWDYEVALADDDYALWLRVEDTDGQMDELPHLWDFTVSAVPTVSGIVLDSTGDSGRWSAIELDASGNPLIAFTQRPTGGPTQVNLIRCTAPDCSTYVGPNFVAVVAVMGGGPQVTDAIDLELDSNGHPVIGINGTVARCVDTECSNPAVVFSIGPGAGMSLELDASDNPVSSGGWGLNLTHCTDVDCINSVTRSLAGSGEEIWTSLALDGSDNPVIASWDWSSDRGSDLRLTRCSDPFCADPYTSEVVETGYSEVNWKSVSLALDGDSFPVIAAKQELADGGYVDNPRVLRCTDIACSGPVSVEPAAINSFAGEVSLALDPLGWPVVAFADWMALIGQRDAAVVFCADATCSAGPIKIVVDNEASAEQLAVAVDAAGNAYVSYYDAIAADLRFAYVAAP